MTTPDRPWILGVRPKRVVGGAWQPIVQSILLREFLSAPVSPNTAAAEQGLGISPCVYFYVYQTTARFGSVVFLWRENPAEPLKAADGAVAPFDTGGIWHERLVTDPQLPQSERQLFVQTHSRSVDRWFPEFMQWIGNNYTTVEEYLEGQPPSVGVPLIVYDSRNEDGGWTWEARIEKTSWREQMLIGNIFWSRSDRSAFEDWLIHDSAIDTKVAEELIELIQTVSIETPPHEQASVEVARYLMRIA